MDLLVLVRHGECSGKDLSDAGKKHIRTLADRLLPFVQGRTLVVLSSPLTRTRQSAEIIASKFNADYQINDLLDVDGSGVVKVEDLLELSRNCQQDVAVWVTHQEHLEEFPEHFAITELGIGDRRYPVHYEDGFESSPDRLFTIKKGAAWVIDCKNKVFHYLEPQE